LPRVRDIEEKVIPDIKLKRYTWVEKLFNIKEGGIYLLAGEPGIGKTTLALQICCDIAEQGIRVLYLTTEQSPSDLLTTIRRIFSSEGALPSTIGENLLIEPLANLEDLEFWTRILLGEKPVKEYSNIKLVVIDSVQAGGVSPHAKKAYQKLFKFSSALKNHYITSVLISHVTKAGLIAGPKDLERFVDCIILYRKAFKLRPLFVPKNRFGPAKLEPYVVTMDEQGLHPSRHVTPKAANINAICLTTATYAEAQAKVHIPQWGELPKTRAPYLPRQKIHHLIDAIRGITNIDISELTFNISCYIPGQRTQYSFGFDLAIIVALLSSYLQLDVPQTYGFYGEVDLTGTVRSACNLAEAKTLKKLYNHGGSEESMEEDEMLVVRMQKHLTNLDDFTKKLRNMETLFVPMEVSEQLIDVLNLYGFDINCVGVDSINTAIEKLWPEIF
jgi:DNA repair protein RadA/Sms